MSSIPLKISERTHAILEPDLHDGYLVAIRLIEDQTVELTAAEVNGKRYRIVLDGVSHLVATDFRQGNIIFDVLVMKGEQVQIQDVEPLLHVGPDGQVHQGHLRQMHEQVVRDSLYVIEVNPSYGCVLTGIAKNISIFHDDDRE